jgi:hypothetical protein
MGDAGKAQPKTQRHFAADFRRWTQIKAFLAANNANEREFNSQNQNLPRRHPPRRTGYRHGEMIEQEKQKPKSKPITLRRAGAQERSKKSFAA